MMLSEAEKCAVVDRVRLLVRLSNDRFDPTVKFRKDLPVESRHVSTSGPVERRDDRIAIVVLPPKDVRSTLGAEREGDLSELRPI